MKNITALIFLLAMYSSALASAEFPNSELILKYVNKPAAARATADSCTGVHRDETRYPECWGAQKASELLNGPADTRELVLNRDKRRQVEAKCNEMSMKERFEARACQALVQAQNFFMFLGSPTRSNFIRF